MRHSISLASLTSLALSASAFATIQPTKVYGDSYLVKDGTKLYAVMDCYIKCSTSKDIISSLFGVSAYTSSYTLNNGKTFQQSGADPTNKNSWLPNNNDGSAWDSYVTNGARVQGSDNTLAGGKAGFLNMQLDSNWGSDSSGQTITSAPSTGGPGWYPAIGASSATNPYCRSGYNGGLATTAGYWNTTKFGVASAPLGQPGDNSYFAGVSALTANGFASGGVSLSNYWMIGRFTIDVTGSAANDFSNTLTLQFAVAGRNYASDSATTFTTITGATNSAGRFSQTLTFVPAPGAAALVGMAGLLVRRRSRA